MKYLSHLIISLTVILIFSTTAAAQWDVQSDTWDATDGLGRALPTATETGPPREGKQIGVFYFLWNGRHGEAGPFDVNKILAQDPDAMRKKDSPLWGPLYAPHHWGESVFHYYVGEDEGVLRKHAQMLGDAGVDAIIFDVTNQLTYPESYRALCKVFSEIRAAGNHAPQIAFLTPFWSPKKVVHELYRDLYSKGDYADLWYRWDGKPLIMADPNLIGDDEQAAKIREFFTFRKPQPDYFAGPTGPNQWGWLEIHPQHGFYILDKDGNPVVEQVAVGTAQNAVAGKLGVLSNPQANGRSYHDGKEPPPAEQDFTGKNFAEQWRRAMELDPKFVFITGWNEWIMNRFDETAPFHGVGPVTFVDQCNTEFSRDIEPMIGGHEDAYYYQFIAYNRRFKGTRPVAKVVPQPVVIDGKFDDWADVSPEFRDTIGDPVRRDERGWGKGTRYTNTTGRNDLVVTKVSYDAENAYFYVRTRDEIVGAGDANWVMLYIDVDGETETGWLGYDLVVNREMQKIDAGADANAKVRNASVEKNVDGKYEWSNVTTVDCRVQGNELELTVPIRLLGTKDANGESQLPDFVRFKWADNIQQTGEWSDLTINGDVAPNDRYNYRAVFR